MTDPKTARVHRFFAGTGRSYDRIVKLLTFGADIYWKRKILGAIPSNPALIVDQACGTGILSMQQARRWPRCRVVGVELRPEYLDIGRSRAAALHLENLQWIVGRAEDVRLRAEADCITSSYLAKYADLQELIANARRMLRPGGRLILHDFTRPVHDRFYRLWRVYLGILKSVGPRIWPQWRTVFFELPPLLESTRWVTQACGLLRANRFTSLQILSMTGHTSVMLVAERPRRPARH